MPSICEDYRCRWRRRRHPSVFAIVSASSHVFACQHKPVAANARKTTIAAADADLLREEIAAVVEQR